MQGLSLPPAEAGSLGPHLLLGLQLLLHALCPGKSKPACFLTEN